MKDFSGSKFENDHAGNLRDFSVQLPERVADLVEHYALGKGETAEEFLRELVTETVEEQAEPLEVRVQRVTGLLGQIAVLVNKTPMQEEKAAKPGALASEERKRKRDHLIELGLEAYDELRKISKSEQASKEAEFRLQAFTVMARVGKFNASIIRDQEAGDLTELIAEVEETNEQLGAKLNELEKKRREKEEEEEERRHAPHI